MCDPYLDFSCGLMWGSNASNPHYPGQEGEAEDSIQPAWNILTLTSVHTERGLVHGGWQDRSARGVAIFGQPPAGQREQHSITIGDNWPVSKEHL